MKNTHTNYYLAAVLQRQMDAPPSQLAYTQLQATWEASGSLYTAYATEALEAFMALLGAESPNSKLWVSYQLIAGELERRLKKFDAAAERFSKLQDNSDLDPFVKSIIELQRQLISVHNPTQQPMPSEKK